MKPASHLAISNRLTSPLSPLLRARRGFTLVEVMIAVAIMAILLGIAIPNLQDATLSSKLSTIANNLTGSALLARSEAGKRNTNITLCVSTNGTSCTTGGWEQGWIVMCKTANATTCDSAGSGSIVILHQKAAPNGFKVTEASSANTVIFDSTGTNSTSATMKVCRSLPNVGQQERQVSINASGRAAISKTATGTCT